MGIPDEDVARVRTATDIVALIGEHAALKRQGRRWVGLCPFHAEKTPSFSVNAEEGFYYCFGCQAKGDAITFVRETEHLDFVDSVHRLADRSGIVIRDDGEANGTGVRRKPYLDVMEQATQWYHHRLLTGPDAGAARDYLRSRGYDGDVVRKFRLGWAPDGWDGLCAALRLDEELAVGAGLGFVNRRGKLQDAFRARVLFPICDPSGKPVAFGGRILPGSPDPAKYKNSSETPVYSKRKVLYALNWAKDGIISAGEVVVCEGYTDVIGCFEAGIERAVATCGTALGDEHFRLLRNFARRIVLAFDADGAGQSAASRFYEWERRHEVDVVVADLPPGSDPGELARTDPDRLRAAIGGAKPFLGFRVDRVLAGADLTTPEGRAKAAEAALAMVAEHPVDLVRDQYVMAVSGRCHLPPESLRGLLERMRREGLRPDGGQGGGRGRVGARPGTGSGGSPEPGRIAPGGTGDDWVRDPDDGDPGSSSDPPGRLRSGPTAGRLSAGRNGRFPPGLEALRLAIHRPEDVARWLEPVLFRDDLQRSALEALLSADDLHQAVDRAEPEVRALLVRLAVEDPIAEPEEVVLQLVREATRQELAVVTREPGIAPATVSDAATATLWLQQLDDPSTAEEATARLVAWLSGRGRDASVLGEP